MRRGNNVAPFFYVSNFQTCCFTCSGKKLARAALLWTPNDRLSFLLAADGNDGSGGMNPYYDVNR